MGFSSHIFVFYFLPLVLLCYYALPGRGRNLLLALFSYFFYGWANPLFVVLLFFRPSSIFVAAFSSRDPETGLRY